MGKKRIATAEASAEVKSAAIRPSLKKRLEAGVIFIQATYNNTLISLADSFGNTVLWSSSGALGFSGAKRGTPFAASKVAEWIADRAGALGVKEVAVVLKGVGPGRESALRTLAARGVVINVIKDVTPIPFNGPRPAKRRRV